MNKLRPNYPIRIAAVLLCLIIFSTYLMSGMLARYTNNGNANDLAGIAEFNITASVLDNGAITQGLNVDIAPSDDVLEYKIRIQNNSEVAVDYTVSVTNETENLPLIIKLNDDAKAKTTGVIAVDDNNFREYTLTIDWLNDEENNFQYHREIDYIKIEVICRQVD